MTGPGKQVLSTQNTLVCIMAYIPCSVCAIQSVGFIKYLMDFCIYDDIIDIIRITDKKLIHFKLSESGQILHVDNTSFPMQARSHIISC